VATALVAMEQAPEVTPEDDDDGEEEEEEVGMANDEADGRQRSDARIMNTTEIWRNDTLIRGSMIFVGVVVPVLLFLLLFVLSVHVPERHDCTRKRTSERKLTTFSYFSLSVALKIVRYAIP
jgi:hypothetical protein